MRPTEWDKQDPLTGTVDKRDNFNLDDSWKVSYKNEVHCTLPTVTGSVPYK